MEKQTTEVSPEMLKNWKKTIEDIDNPTMRLLLIRAYLKIERLEGTINYLHEKLSILSTDPS